MLLKNRSFLKPETLLSKNLSNIFVQKTKCPEQKPMLERQFAFSRLFKHPPFNSNHPLFPNTAIEVTLDNLPLTLQHLRPF